MPAFDVNVLVALVDEDHPHHPVATRLFDTAGTVLLHPCVLTEFTTVIRRHAKSIGQDGNAAARRALRAVLAQPRVTVEPSIPEADAIARYLAFPGLSFTDAVVAEMRWHHDRQEPITFDQGVVKASRATSKEVRAMLEAQRDPGGSPPSGRCQRQPWRP